MFESLAPAPLPPRWPLAVGGLLLALAVALSALASHALPELMADPLRAQRFTTALQMHLFNALGLLLIGNALLCRPDNRLWRGAAAVLVVGMGLFCGNLYGLAVVQHVPLPWLTPVGGLCLIGAWLLFALGALWRRR